jgi:hypothetical protein
MYERFRRAAAPHYPEGYAGHAIDLKDRHIPAS